MAVLSGRIGIEELAPQLLGRRLSTRATKVKGFLVKGTPPFRVVCQDILEEDWNVDIRGRIPLRKTA